MFLPLHTLWKFPRYPLNRRLGGMQCRCGRFEEGRNVLILRSIKTRFLGRQISNLVKLLKTFSQDFLSLLFTRKRWDFQWHSACSGEYHWMLICTHMELFFVVIFTLFITILLSQSRAIREVNIYRTKLRNCQSKINQKNWKLTSQSTNLQTHHPTNLPK